MITSGGLGTMGFGLPGAIGAQVGQLDRTVVDIDGDGSFTMTLPELATAVEQNLPVVLLNNSFQGMVRQWQELFFNKRYSATRMQNPDFSRLADAFGAKGLRITEKADVPDGVRELLETEGCVVADFHVEPEENVYPMVTVGKSLDEMELGGLA